MKIGAIPESLLERLLTLIGLAPTPLIDTFHAVIVARTIAVATKLGVVDAVASKPRSAQELASHLAVDARALEKLLNLLVSSGYLRFRDERYAPTRLARRWLLQDSPQSLHDSMLLRFLEWEAMEGTEDFVRTGRALDVHDLIREEQWVVYQRGMRSLAEPLRGRGLKQGPATFSRDRDAGSGRRSRRVFSGLLPTAPSIASNNHRPSPCSRKRGTHPCGRENGCSGRLSLRKRPDNGFWNGPVGPDFYLPPPAPL